MDVDNVFRRLRGALGNAVVWGVCWSVAALGVIAVTSIGGGPVPWRWALGMAARTGVMGGIAGGAFSAVIGLLYRGRRLSEISWVRFGVRGGIAAGLFVPSFMTVARLLSGEGFVPLENLVASTLVAAAFGGVAAAVSLKVAQRADTLLPGRDASPPDQLEPGDPFASAATRDRAVREVADPRAGGER